MNTQEFISIETVRLYPSPRNPRQTFNAERLADLKKSIAEHGVLTPLLVRPGKDDNCEIIAGERRYRAAKELGLETLPCVVREMDDRQALEVMITENLQRDDIHPLEEAEGYKALLDEAGYDIPTLAAKVGKSSSYIYQRLKLAELVPAAKKAFRDGQLTPGHAILVARLQPNDQKDALKFAIQERYDGNEHVASVRELGDYIARNFHLDLSKAPWKKDDAELLPSAGPCTTCPKRTGCNRDLFNEIKKGDYCTDATCYNAKLDNFVARRLADLPDAPRISVHYDKKQAGDALPSANYRLIHGKKDGCEHAEQAIQVDGGERGQTVKVCATPDCKKHGIRNSLNGAGSSQDYAKRERAQADKHRRESIARAKTLDLILDKVGELRTEDLRVVARRFFEEMTNDTKSLMFKRNAWEPTKRKGSYGTFRDLGKDFATHVDSLRQIADLYRLLIELALVPETKASTFDASKPQNLIATAERYKVEMVPVEPAAKPKAKAKPAADKPQRGVCRKCGCTDEAACPGGCSWVDKTHTLCSSHGDEASATA